jgi:hypothetical protein
MPVVLAVLVLLVLLVLLAVLAVLELPAPSELHALSASAITAQEICRRIVE